MTKLYELETGKEVDVPSSDVKLALGSGRFGFKEGQRVPIRGPAGTQFTTPEYAGKYREHIDFAEEPEALKAEAEQKYGGVGGMALGGAYGVGTSATFGALPYVLGKVGGKAKQFARDIELAQPGAVMAGEVGGLFLDPLAAAAKAGESTLLRLGGKAAEKGAAKLGAEAAEAGAAKLGAEAVEAAAPAVAEAAAPVASESLKNALKMAERQERVIVQDLNKIWKKTERMPAGPKAAARKRIGEKIEAARERLGEIEHQRFSAEVGGPKVPEWGVPTISREPFPVEPPPGLGGAVEEAAAAAPAESLATAPSSPFTAGLGREMAESSIYAGARQAGRQEVGLEEGGTPEVLGAMALGAALPPVFRGAGKLAGAALGGVRELGAGIKAPPGTFAKEMKSLEETHALRFSGLRGKQVGRLEGSTEVLPGTKGYVDFMKGELSDIPGLQQLGKTLEERGEALPHGSDLQEVATGGKLRLGNITPEQRVGLAEAIERKNGMAYDTLFGDIKDAEVPPEALERVASVLRSLEVPGIGREATRSIKPEFREFERLVETKEPVTIDQLRQLITQYDESFSMRQGLDSPFTEAQKMFRKELKNAYLQRAEELKPELRKALRDIDRRYELSTIMLRGMQRERDLFKTQSPIGPDLISQVLLGFAIGHPLNAIAFGGLGALARRAYQKRGEGIIADVAGRLAERGENLSRLTPQASSEIARSIVSGGGGRSSGMLAEKLVSTTPEEYRGVVSAVRDLQRNREKLMQDVDQRTYGMSPQEREEAKADVDRRLNALASRVPEGLSLEGKLTEQSRRYVIYARSVLDPAYALEVIAKGGEGAQEAADGFKAANANGEDALSKIAEDLKERIETSHKIEDRPAVLQTYRNIARFSSRSRIPLGLYHAPAGAAGLQPKIAPVPRVNASGQQRAVTALSGAYKP